MVIERENGELEHVILVEPHESRTNEEHVVYARRRLFI